MTGSEATRLYNAVPAPLPGFENIGRYWDAKHNVYAAKIIQGEYYVSGTDEMITTVLGSCVAACIRERRMGLGGMNHFMLPGDETTRDRWQHSPVNVMARYGTVAMERLINAILAQGGERRNLEIKLFGGGRVLDIGTDIGKLNIDFARTYLAKEGFRVAAEDLGGVHPRKIMYFPGSGRVFVKKLFKLHNDTLVKRERKYYEQLRTLPESHEVELFSDSPRSG